MSDEENKSPEDSREEPNPYKNLDSRLPTHLPPKRTLQQGRPSRDETRHMQDKFLESFVRVGTVSDAAALAGIDRRSHSSWMKKSRSYARRFALAEEAARDNLLSIARRRATVGTREQLWYKGEPIIDPKTREQAIRYHPSDALMMAFLEAEFPERFIKRVEHSGVIRIEAVSHLLIGIVQLAREYVPPTLIEEFVEKLAQIGTQSLPTLATAAEEPQGEDGHEPQDDAAAEDELPGGADDTATE